MDNIFIGKIIEFNQEETAWLQLINKPSMAISRRFLGNYHNGV